MCLITCSIPRNHLITPKENTGETGQLAEDFGLDKLLYADQLISGRIVDIHEVMIDTKAIGNPLTEALSPNRSVA